MDDSVLIIKHYCHNCDREVDHLKGHNCGVCDSSFIEEMPNTSDSAFAETNTEANKENKQSDQTLEICSICLEQITAEEEPLVQLKCDHKYHKKCIKSWFAVHNTCPLCRNKVKVDEYVTPRRRRNILPERNPLEGMFNGLRARIVLEDVFATEFDARPRVVGLQHRAVNSHYAQPIRSFVAHRGTNIRDVSQIREIIQRPRVDDDRSGQSRILTRHDNRRHLHN